MMTPRLFDYVLENLTRDTLILAKPVTAVSGNLWQWTGEKLAQTHCQKALMNIMIKSTEAEVAANSCSV